MSKKRAQGPEPEDAAAGKVRVSLHELVAMIDRVNPTGRGLSTREEERRYALKSRLQSLLVRMFAQQVVVKAVDDVTVALAIDGTGTHAAHARIDALDDDARSWVRMQLDSGAAGSAAVVQAPGAPELRQKDRPGSTSPATGEETIEGMLEAVSRRLAEYDYEEARRLAMRAFERAPAQAGTVLVELLVDYVGDDLAALEVGERLPPVVLARSDVRVRLATAALRSRDRARAERELSAAEGPEVALLWVELARACLANGELAAAARAIDAADAGSAPRGVVHELRGELGHGRAQARAPAEAPQRALLDRPTRNVASVADAARALLAAHPDSVLARRALQEIEREQRLATAEARIVEARRRAAAGHGDPAALDAAVAGAQEAIVLGADATALEGVMREWRDRAGALRSEQLVALLVTRLATGLDEAALVELAGAAADVRARVRARAREPDLDLLEELRPEASSAARAAARAVIAVRSAREAIAAGDPHRAVELLDADRVPGLRALDAARALRSIAREQLEQLRIEQGGTLLAQARDASANGDWAQAAALLDRLPHTSATATERFEQEAGEIRRAIADAHELAALHEPRHAPLEERARCERLAGFATTPAEAERWLASAAEADRAAHAALGYRVLEDGPSLDVETPSDHRGAAACWVHDSGLMLVPAQWGPWLVLQFVDLTSGRTQRRVLARPPAAALAEDVVWDASGIFVPLADGIVLVLSPDGRRLVKHVGLALGHRVEQALVAPSDGVVWQLRSGPEPASEPEARVVELETGRVLRELGGAFEVTPLRAAVRPLRVARFTVGSCAIFTPRGRRAAPSMAFAAQVRGVADAGGGALWVLSGADDDDGLALQLVTEAGVVAARRVVDGSPERVAYVVALEDGCCVTYWGGPDETAIEAYAREDNDEPTAKLPYRLTLAWRVDAGGRVMLANDAVGGTAALLSSAATPAVQPLSLSAPPVGRSPAPLEPPWQSAPDRRRNRAARNDAQNALNALLAAAEAELGGDHTAERDRLAAAELPNDASEAAMRARLMVGRHLLTRGEHARAIQTWRDAVQLGPEAQYAEDLREWIAYAERTYEQRDPPTRVGERLAAIRAADAALAAPDPGRAVEILERDRVTEEPDADALDRLTAAWLALEAPDVATWLRKLVALGIYVDRAAALRSAWSALLPTAEQWAPARNEDLRARAAAWLRSTSVP